ncbi:cytochrome P450 [Fomes fomentarius]|nr:cytochrome P450 [Fomes fomentarius]
MDRFLTPLVPIILLLGTVWIYARRKRQFLVGNLYDIPDEFKYLDYQALCEKYGDIVYMSVLGQPIIIIGSQQAAIDLLDKCSAKYSDRMFSIMAETDFTWFFAISPYGPRWRKTRRAFYETMNANAVADYRPTEERAVKRYLLRLLENPTRYRENAQYMFNATIIAVTYGLDVHAKPDNDKYIQIAEKTMNSFHIAFTLGEHHVETFPFLRHLPAWFPFAKFKYQVPIWSADARRLRDEPWEAAHQAMLEGRFTPSMASMLTTEAKTEEDVTIAKSACASAYAAMTLFPEVQRRAQAELDAVIGSDRLPTHNDKPSLPYITALLTEVYRWKPVVPLGVPHRVMEDDEYQGYRIPRGAITIQIPWAYCQDRGAYPKPEEFRPERFLKEGKFHLGDLDPGAFAFGYGRRICPGRHFAEEMLFLTIASVLHCFNIIGPRDQDGEPVKFELKFTDTSPMHPQPFECKIEPRSSAAEALIRESCPESELVNV